MTKLDLAALTTESPNPRTAQLDAMTTIELLTVMNDEDRTVAEVVRQARKAAAFTAAVVGNAQSPVAAAAEVAIEVVTGPEVLTGSTRLKAGTATKMVLNMLTTGAFVRLHKVYGNLMVDLQPTSEKLLLRSRRIVALAARC